MARRSTSNSTGKGKGKVEKVMREYKHGSLRSSSGAKVRKRKQAVAIALSEARQAGARIPRKGGSKRSSSRSK
jgi:Family of unknown function (DUF6496)